MAFTVDDDRTPRRQLRAEITLSGFDPRTSMNSSTTFPVAVDALGRVDTAFAPTLLGEVWVGYDVCDDLNQCAGVTRFPIRTDDEKIPVVSARPVTPGRAIEDGVEVTWTPYVGAYFDGYRVQRSSSPDCGQDFFAVWETIETIDDQRAYSFVDRGPFPLANQFCYRVITGKDYGQPIPATVSTPRPGLFATPLGRLYGHPTERFAYTIIDDEFVRLDLDRLAVAARTKLGTQAYHINDATVATDAQGRSKVYALVQQHGLYILDATTLAEERFIPGDFLFGAAPFPDQGFFVVYDAQYGSSHGEGGLYVTRSLADGSLIDTYRASTGSPARISRCGNRFAVVASTAYQHQYISLDADGRFAPGGPHTVANKGAYFAARATVDPAGRYWVSGNTGRVYAADESRAVRGDLQRGDERFGGFATSGTGDVLYAGTYQSEGLPIAHQIIRTRYPSFVRESPIDVEGPVASLARCGDRLAALVEGPRHGSGSFAAPSVVLLQVFDIE